MDYEKKYNEALERARANYKADKEMGFLENCDMLELIFPELRESEDESREEAAKEYANGIIHLEDALMCKAAFIAGAEWQKSQMLKDAVEGKIYGYGDGSYELVASWLDLPKGGIFKFGQKVRIVVLKAEEEEQQ